MIIEPTNMSAPTLERYLPETESYFKLGDVAQNIARYASSAASYFNRGGLNSPYQDLLSAQTEAQMQLMQVSLQSNLSRTEHETKMAVVRNVRVA